METESNNPCCFHKMWRWALGRKYFTQDGFIHLLEFLIISSLSIAILSIIFYYLFWIFFGIGDEISDRMSDILQQINDNWKIFIIIIIPIFLRPIRILLEQPEKMKGILHPPQIESSAPENLGNYTQKIKG